MGETVRSETECQDCGFRYELAWYGIVRPREWRRWKAQALAMAGRRPRGGDAA